MSEEVASAFVERGAFDTLWAEKEQWQESYTRVCGAFELHMDIDECKQAMADYAGIVYDAAIGALADQSVELQSQLASAHEQLLLAEADRETLATTVRAYMAANSYSDRGRRLGQLKDLLRTEHPGQALADEVTRARAEIAILKKALDQIDRHAVGAYTTEEGAGANVEPCDECGEMREIAAQALAAAKARAK